MNLTWSNVTVTLRQLHPWQGNPKTTTAKQAGQLVTSHDDLGQFQTVAISPFDAAGLALVYDGHQRLSAWLQAYGPDFTIQALQASRPLTEQEQRKIAIYSRQIGAWDWDILSGWEPEELTGWGFDVDLLRDWGRDYSNLAEMLDAITHEPQSLDDLEAEYGEPADDDFYPIIKLKVTPETYDKYNAIMAAMPGRDDMEKFDALLSGIVLS